MRENFFVFLCFFHIALGVACNTGIRKLVKMHTLLNIFCALRSISCRMLPLDA